MPRVKGLTERIVRRRAERPGSRRRRRVGGRRGARHGARGRRPVAHLGLLDGRRVGRRMAAPLGAAAASAAAGGLLGRRSARRLRLARRARHVTVLAQPAQFHNGDSVSSFGSAGTTPARETNAELG